MAELVPLPLPLLLKRAFLEYEREGKIFDLPRAKFFRGLPGLDLSVSFHGHRASTPLGPAAGPHGQLAQNIVLSWLGGSRIIELKTIQILDELKIPRPCIDVANVGYNVEWSQELKLEQSLGEYVGAAMFLEILKASRLLGEDFPFGETVFDMSAGYSLEGIRSPRVRQWIESMKNAAPVIDGLRAGLTGRWARYRDLPFPTRISDTVSLSTFHGCPAGEIEAIAGFLLTEMDVDVCVKLNPTLLGYEEVDHLLHYVLGYQEIQLSRETFEHDLQFAEAMDLVPRLQRLARAHGRSFSVKFSNTLVVKNHKPFFSDETMYLSGQPLHVLTLNLVKKFREHAVGRRVPISFSAGLDAHNVASAVAMNFVPVTTCTDLLRPGGYGRLIRYLENLGSKMRELGVTRISDLVVRYAGQGAAAVERVMRDMGLPPGAEELLKDWLETSGPLSEVCGRIGVPEVEEALVNAAGLLNTPVLVTEATANPRYRWERNQGSPRKIGSKLWLYDCIDCDKCVPVCPNDANFAYETAPREIAYDNFELLPEGIRRIPGGVLRLVRGRQFANYADACNDCGNCDVFCPEDGGPYVEKPRFFGSLETYRKYGGRNGFYMEWPEPGVCGADPLVCAGPPGPAPNGPARGPAADRGVRPTGSYLRIHGTLAGERYVLTFDPAADRASFESGGATIEIRLSDNQPLSWTGQPGAVDMLPYLKLKLLAEAAGDPRHVHFANVAGLQEVASEEGAL